MSKAIPENSIFYELQAEEINSVEELELKLKEIRDDIWLDIALPYFKEMYLRPQKSTAYRTHKHDIYFTFKRSQNKKKLWFLISSYDNAIKF